MDIDPSVLVDGFSGKSGPHVLSKGAGFTEYRITEARPHRTQSIPTDEQCPCWAFKFCDATYHNMTPPERAIWRAALKKSGMSGYTLWMKECLTLVNQGLNPPDEPSVSGGHAADKAVPGVKYPLPEGNPCGPPPPPPPPPLGDDCEYCYVGTAKWYQIDLEQANPPIDAWNGTWVVEQDPGAPCEWNHQYPLFDLALRRLAPNSWYVRFEGVDPVGNLFLELAPGPASCLEACELYWLMSPPHWGDQMDSVVYLSGSTVGPPE